MKLRFTSRDFILLLGIMVAAIITIATLFFRDSLITVRPGVSKKMQAANHASILLRQSPHLLFGKD
jgi:hypothetical protein